MNELALFAGSGGGILGGILSGFRTVCAVEIDQYCRQILLQRQRDGILPFFPVWDDVRTFDGRPWKNHIQVITAGFPCQPFSVAGKKRGELDERNMWPDTVRIIGEVKPDWCLLENVPGLLSSGYFGRILSDLAEVGYNARWGCLSASTLGAPHKRERLWIVAHSKRLGRQERCKVERILSGMQENRKTCNKSNRPDKARKFSDSSSQGRNESDFNKEGQTSRPTWWDSESGMDRMVDGVAHRVDRLKALGNGQVPAVANGAWKLLRGKK